MQDLRITLLQQDLHWHAPDANRAMFEELIWGLEEPVDVILLPEMFTTGFSMKPSSLAEPHNLHTFRWMKQVATQSDALVIGSYIVREGEACYNRLLAVEPGGNHHIYDKHHLFSMAGEDKHYTSGDQHLVISWRGWRIRPLVCYDLRFPVWSRNRVLNGRLEYDLLLYVANWPAPRINVWDRLLGARAIENLAYAAGVNRVGTDNNDIRYTGHSGIYHPGGERLAFLGDQPGVLNCTLSGNELNKFREEFPVHHDFDKFRITDDLE